MTRPARPMPCTEPVTRARLFSIMRSGQSMPVTCTSRQEMSSRRLDPRRRCGRPGPAWRPPRPDRRPRCGCRRTSRTMASTLCRGDLLGRRRQGRGKRGGLAVGHQRRPGRLRVFQRPGLLGELQQRASRNRPASSSHHFSICFRAWSNRRHGRWRRRQCSSRPSGPAGRPGPAAPRTSFVRLNTGRNSSSTISRMASDPQGQQDRADCADRQHRGMPANKNSLPAHMRLSQPPASW